MEDKTVEAIAKVIYAGRFIDQDAYDQYPWDICEAGEKEAYIGIATQILQTLTSLGYVKLADEQRFPDGLLTGQQIMILQNLGWRRTVEGKGRIKW